MDYVLKYYILMISFFIGHGICEEETRVCVCEAFWMHNLYRTLFGDGESNCGKVHITD